ncbi:MAG TPA: hypothetical protein VJ260_06545 [Vicinamibacterales bacterium]|nr:hypothetical protein [Vicinamibacterales bacterium]
MIRTLIKLVIVLVVLNGLYRFGDAYWDHYQFEDSVQQLAQFSENATADDVRAKVLELARSQDIPLTTDNLTVTRVPRRIEVDGVYVRELALFPTYIKPWDFKLHVVVVTLN